VENEGLGHASGPGHRLGRHLVERDVLHQTQTDGDELGPAGIRPQAAVRTGEAGSGGNVDHVTVVCADIDGEAAGKTAGLCAERGGALRARLTPGYRIGCKRILISNDYLTALTQPNVDLVPAGLAEVRARSVVDADGRQHDVDTIIFGTG
jgi:hypothetical protein